MKKILMFVVLVFMALLAAAYATPTTLIWTPSTDIQPYKKVHVGYDLYAPVESVPGQSGHVVQVWGATFSLLSDKQEDNAGAALWEPLGKIMAETGFDYKKGLGSFYDATPWYFHFKCAVPENAYYSGMPAVALGGYDIGTKTDRTNNNLWYGRIAKTLFMGTANLGRLSAGYFSGNQKLLRDGNGRRDNNGVMLSWERTMSEISEKLWLCVDYQGTDSSYGAVSPGFAYKLTSAVSFICGYSLYNNRDLPGTVTFQMDIDL